MCWEALNTTPILEQLPLTLSLGSSKELPGRFAGGGGGGVFFSRSSFRDAQLEPRKLGQRCPTLEMNSLVPETTWAVVGFPSAFLLFWGPFVFHSPGKKDLISFFAGVRDFQPRILRRKGPWSFA